MSLDKETTSPDSNVRKVMGLMPLPVLVHQMGSIVYANKLMYELLGAHLRDELVGKSILDFIHPEDHEKIIRFVERGQSGKESDGRINTRVKVDRIGYKVLDTNSVPIVYNGQDCRMVVVYDYTEKEIIEEKLEQKDLLLQRLADILPDFVTVHELPGRKKLFENLSLFNFMGYDQGDAGLNEMEFLSGKVHPEDLDKIIAINRNRVLNTGYLSTEYRLQSKNKEWKWFRTRTKTINKTTDPDSPVWSFSFTQDISRQKEMEMRLTESKQFAEKISGAIPSLLIIYNLKKSQISYTNFGRNFLGYTQEEFLERGPAKNLCEIIGVEGENKIRLTHLQEGEVLTQPISLSDSGGMQRELLSRIKAFSRNERGEVEEMICSLIDITEQTLVRQKLGRSEMLYKAIANSIPNGFVLAFDQDLSITLANGPLLASMGIRPGRAFEPDAIANASFYGYPWGDLTEHFKETLEGKFSKLEKLIDGFELQLFFQPLFEDGGSEIYGGLLVTYDVKEIKETKNALYLSEDTRKAILEAIPDLVFKLNGSGTIIDYYMNEAQQNIISNFSLMNKQVSELMRPEESERIVKIINDCLDNGKVGYYELNTVDFGADFWYELRFSKLNDQEVIAIVRDITDLKQTTMALDEKLAEISMKNIELERYITSNSELEKFAYITSHDLKEPVRSIIGFAQLLRKRSGGSLDDSLREYIDNIIDGAQRMNNLITGLLDYSRINSQGKPFEKVDLMEILSKVKKDLIQMMEESGAVVIADQLPEIYGDKLQVRQLFQNLISNSIKFKSTQNPLIQIDAKKDGAFWHFTVKDNGIGFEMKYKDKLFTLFSRLHTNDKYPGSGIGLALCKKIVDRHNGRIWLHAVPGVGTTVEFTIPA